MVSHGRKMSKLGFPHKRVQPTIEIIWFRWLIWASCETTDKGLLPAFVER